MKKDKKVAGHRRLTLETQTVRLLETASLVKVAGGQPKPTVDGSSCPSCEQSFSR